MAVSVAYGPGQVPLLEDNQHYFFMSERLADGVPPHVSNFDLKNMLSVLLTGLGIEAGRWAGISDVAASRVVSMATFAVAAGLLSVFTYRMVGSRLAAGVAALVPAGLPYLPLMVASGSRPKVFLFLFMAASLFFLTRRRWRAAMLSASMGFLTWQPALLLVAGVATARWLADRDLRGVAALTGIGAVPVVVYEAWFASRGALSEQVTQAYVFPAKYMTGQFDGPVESVAALGEYWGWGYSVDAVGVDLTWTIPVLFACASAVCAFRLRRWIGETDRPLQALRDRPAALHFGLTMAGAFAFTWYDASGAPDFFFVFPYVAVVIAAAAAIVARRAERSPMRYARSVFAAGLGGGLLLLSAAGAREAQFLPFDLDDQRTLGARVGSWMAAGQSVYAVATTHLLAFNRAPNWTRYSYFFRGLPDYLRARTGSSVYVPRRGGDLPDVVLTSRSYPPGWPAWLTESGYRRMADDGFARQQIRVWRRVGREPSDGPASALGPRREEP